MKRNHSALQTILIAMTLLCTLLFCDYGFAETIELSAEQRNAIAMLNYITVLTQDINASKNSRLYMEEAYSTLVNNTYPNAVDSRTQSQMTGLLDTMENYRMIAVKRDRLQFIYEQNQAQAIRAAIPNPLALMSAVQSYRPSKLVASIVYMAVDAAASYMYTTTEHELQFINDGWALDDEEATVLHNSRKGIFNYMISMVRDNNLPGDLTLTESAVEELVKWKTNENVVGRIQFLESNKKTYEAYGGYWLILASSYYEGGEYKKCLDAVTTYEAMETRIFRRDYDYARILPLAISALDEVNDSSEYNTRAAAYARAILDNTDNNDWALRYFAAQTFIDLFSKTTDRNYLQDAYDITLDNVNYLVGEQRAMNTAFLSPIQEASTPKGATKDEKKQISNYNKMLKETRKKELSPISEPLLLNCDLLFALCAELKINENDVRKIDAILHPKDEAIFLVKPLDSLFWADSKNNTTYDTESIEYAGTAIRIPASLITTDAVIEVSVLEAGIEEPETFTDWKLNNVSRTSDTKIEDIKAIYTSEAAKNHKWQPDATIVVTITPRAGTNAIVQQVKFKSIGTKDEWYDYLKVWEGQKNNWYDYLKVWDNSVVFEQVK